MTRMTQNHSIQFQQHGRNLKIHIYLIHPPWIIWKLPSNPSTTKYQSWEGQRRLQQACNVFESQGSHGDARLGVSMRFGLDQGMNEFPMSSIHCKAYGCPHVTLWHPMGCVFSYYMTQYDVSYDVIWLCWPTLNGHIAMWPMVCGSSFCSLIQSTPTRQWSSLLSPRKRAPDTGQVSQMKPPCLLRANPAAQHLWIAMGQPGFCILKPCTKNRIVWVLLSTDLVTSSEEFCFSVLNELVTNHPVSTCFNDHRRLRDPSGCGPAVWRPGRSVVVCMICRTIWAPSESVPKLLTCPKAAFSRWYVVI